MRVSTSRAYLPQRHWVLNHNEGHTMKLLQEVIEGCTVEVEVDGRVLTIDYEYADDSMNPDGSVSEPVVQDLGQGGQCIVFPFGDGMEFSVGIDPSLTPEQQGQVNELVRAFIVGKYRS